jgi:hypothetical protein
MTTLDTCCCEAYIFGKRDDHSEAIKTTISNENFRLSLFEFVHER